jgi:DNA polymerase elongation subunit (family B)
MNDVLEYTESELRELSDSELKKLYAEAESKESLYKTNQLALKTIMNSLYGAMANRWFSLFNEDMAAAITGNGRYFIRKLANNIESTLQNLLKIDGTYIVSGDTDSVYYTINPFMERFKVNNPNLSINEYVDWADAFEKKIIQPVIKKTIDDFASELNAYNKDKIGVEREAIADVGVFTAKKKYYIRLRDNEGTRYADSEPKIKVTGLEIIKSSTPKWSKKYLKESIPIILDGNESNLKDWIGKIKSEFKNSDLNDIASVGAVSRIDYDLSDKGVPFGSRAAIKHNLYIKKNSIENKYAPIQAGDKCKRLFLVEPNKFDTEIIAYTNDNFISEIGDLVNYDEQFVKNFLKPLELMVEPLGYDLYKETEKLEDW